MNFKLFFIQKGWTKDLFRSFVESTRTEQMFMFLPALIHCVYAYLAMWSAQICAVLRIDLNLYL